jgi:hypothetical protein
MEAHRLLVQLCALENNRRTRNAEVGVSITPSGSKPM